MVFGGFRLPWCLAPNPLASLVPVVLSNQQSSVRVLQWLLKTP
jgi:hypothetical protein